MTFLLDQIKGFQKLSLKSLSTFMTQFLQFMRSYGHERINLAIFQELKTQRHYSCYTQFTGFMLKCRYE